LVIVNILQSTARCRVGRSRAPSRQG
jgi:hypothetical protein